MHRRAALGLVFLPSFAGAAPEPASRNDAILARLERIFTRLRESKYSHATLVDEDAGRYEFDCSGLVNWVLRRTAPGAHGVVVGRAKNGRPLARDYYREIASTRPGPRTPRGWARVTRVDEARPGDVIAWLKPELVRSTNTGHVAFLLEEPRPTDGTPGGYLLRVADASRYQHDEDDRSESGRTGFGSGTILVIADPETGAPRAYGWVGLRSRWVLEAAIAIGRSVR
ncbi:MAG TPA: hypothetical protein VM686_04365 [Polyangiaceae bacterium]|nr:hypothetical protein [Polyangiaceae bacterium]